jgi:AraC-like DNA-binding protein
LGTPLPYFRNWRKHLADGYLRDDQISIREIAERVSYESQASFTNAFKRGFSFSPRENIREAQPIVSAFRQAFRFEWQIGLS